MRRALLTCLISLGQIAHADTDLPSGADRDLLARIEAALRDVPGLALEQVQFAIRSGSVLIRGQVPLLEYSLRIEQCTWLTDGVLEVENELRVVPRHPVRDSEIERRIREIVRIEPKFAAARLEVSVTHGEITLRGYFLDPGAILDLKHRVGSLEGVLRIWIDASLVAGRS